MTEQDRYIPGVPCWIDTTQPDPEAAVAFYGELFGWEFEDVMPPGSPGKYFIARLRGGDVAAVGSQWGGGPAGGGGRPAARRVEQLRLGGRRRRDRGQGPCRGRQRDHGARRRHGGR